MSKIKITSLSFREYWNIFIEKWERQPPYIQVLWEVFRDALFALIVVYIILWAFAFGNFFITWGWFMRNYDPLVYIFLLAIIMIFVIYIYFHLSDFYKGKTGGIKFGLWIIVMVMSTILWLSSTNQARQTLHIKLPNVYTPSSTPTSTFTPTNTSTWTSTPTMTLTSTPTNTPTTIYDPIISNILLYFDHIPTNGGENSIDYEIAWSILDPTFQVRFKCDTCGSAKGGWIWYVSQFYFNINQDDLYKSENVDISSSYAKADIHLDRVEIKTGITKYSGVISICLFKRPEGWHITAIYEGKLPEINDCIIS